MTEKPKIYYPYNDFGFYAMPKAGKRAQEFIERNQGKGGTWVLHTKEQFDEWYEKKGKHLQFLGKDIFNAKY